MKISLAFDFIDFTDFFYMLRAMSHELFELMLLYKIINNL